MSYLPNGLTANDVDAVDEAAEREGMARRRAYLVLGLYPSRSTGTLSVDRLAAMLKQRNKRRHRVADEVHYVGNAEILWE